MVLFPNFSLIHKNGQYLTVNKELPSVLVVSQVRFTSILICQGYKKLPLRLENLIEKEPFYVNKSPLAFPGVLT